MATTLFYDEIYSRHLRFGSELALRLGLGSGLESGSGLGTLGFVRIMCGHLLLQKSCVAEEVTEQTVFHPVIPQQTVIPQLTPTASTVAGKGM